MNIIKRTIQRYKNYRTGKRLTRLESDLRMLKNKINFDPRYALDIPELDNSLNYTRRIEEYRTWFIGNSRMLRNMYNLAIKKDCLNYFWYKAPDNYRMIHTGIPGLISSKMATILFGGGLKFTATVYKDEGDRIDEVATQQAQELVDNLCKIIDLNERLENAAQNESWGGHVYFKLSHDTGLSQYPILEVADVRKAEAIKERGITTAIKFKFWYKDAANKEYRLDEIYTTDALGDAVIRYELYQLAKDGSESPKALEDLPQTANLKTEFLLNDNDELVYNGLKGMLAFDKPNRTPSHEFPDSEYGASDYEGALDSFDALDEAYSELIAEIRSNKTIRYIPSSMVPKQIITDSVTGKQVTISLLPNEFVTNYEMVEGGLDQNAKNEMVIQQIPDKTKDNLEKFKTALSTAINCAGLSPLALGITGLESINSSDKSQQERNKVTLETRNKKQRIWKPFIEDVVLKVLELNSWMVSNAQAKQDAFAKLDLTFANLDVKAEFGDYIIEQQSEKIMTWSGAKSSGIASTHEAVSQIHPDWEEAEINEEVNLIRFEQGMSLDNPSNLPELTGTEPEPEKDDEAIKKKQAEDEAKKLAEDKAKEMLGNEGSE